MKRNGKSYIQQNEDNAVIQESGHKMKMRVANALPTLYYYMEQKYGL